MCGILGFAGDPQLSVEGLTRALDTLVHRGPDGQGVEIWPDQGVGLAHRRLTIIDLSDAGRNPMSNEDGRVWITFNGEIFNYRALRSELEALGHHFRSHSDTEVIVHAYEEWGDDHVQRLRGMFAYALYDRRSARDASDRERFRVVLVRDRLGIKPLYYQRKAGRLLFASEIKALLACPGVERHPDRSAIFDYLSYGYVPPPRTAYRDVEELPAAHMAVWEAGKLAVRAWWDVPVGAPGTACDPGEAAEMIREVLGESIVLQTVSDVPVGVFLSGGVDSSSVTAFMARASHEPVPTFCVRFDEAAHSENEYARLVAERWGTRHLERQVGVGSAQELLPRLVRFYDQPFAGSSSVPTHLISATARERVKVVLSGDGGDEVFAGYPRYPDWPRRQARAEWAGGFGAGPLLRWLGAHWPLGWRGQRGLTGLGADPVERFAQFVSFLSPREKRELLLPEWRREFRDYDDHWFLRRHWRDELDPLTRLQYLDLKTYMPSHILTKVDRASMAVSLEVRPPLLDHVLIEKVFGLAPELRAPPPKRLLKDAVRDLLPAPILERPKQGFGSPVDPWLRREREWAAGRLATPTADCLRPLSEVPWLARRPHALWGVLVLQQWLDDEAGVRRSAA